MMNRILASKFDAEKEWDNDEVVKLPAVSSDFYNNIVLAMEELMVAYSSGWEDIVLTGSPMNREHLNYLASLGVCCQNQTENTIKPDDLKAKILETYAVIPDFITFAEENDMVYEHPKMDVIKKVNSKFFSVELAKKYGLNDYSVLVEDYDKLEYHLKNIIDEYGTVMVKEEYGVSGKGNLLVNVKKTDRFLRNTKKQLEKGRHIRYILEPRFEVIKDFSSQWFITKTGEVEYISIQEIKNNGSAYGGSIDIKEDTMAFLRQEGYFEVLKKSCSELYKEGYFGDVCVDSMILEGNKLIPIVEINARKSMSLTKHRLDENFLKNGVKNNISYMFSTEVSYESHMNFTDILKILENHGIIYNSKYKTGIIPITCNTLFINREEGKKLSKGRVYYYVTAKDDETILKILDLVAKIGVYERG
ncbi:hypothetical protein ADH76_06025 [Enterocloster clostridioformis]|nr:hypothetical protein A4V08_33685 [Lachnoclostridium sp. YL32]NDO28472.1 hypothetical protein [Enterocloster clostridioformis]OXE70901.1 hypothetical protein ADH76_06025 [Enterocloster clostridioformis]QQR01058.1 hypothetical protein I5Q83_00955 [Enterocloster clostridioformis]